MYKIFLAFLLWKFIIKERYIALYMGESQKDNRPVPHGNRIPPHHVIGSSPGEKCIMWAAGCAKS